MGCFAGVGVALASAYDDIVAPEIGFIALVWVAIWFGVGIAYFALVGRNRLILSPEEEFAMSHQAT